MKDMVFLYKEADPDCFLTDLEHPSQDTLDDFVQLLSKFILDNRGGKASEERFKRMISLSLKTLADRQLMDRSLLLLKEL